MGQDEPNLSKYRCMWLLAMFDLPVDTPDGRRAYTQFRKSLIRQGFSMLQFSVYARFCRSEERAKALSKRIRKTLPAEGEVRLMAVTDHQFGKMEVFHGKKRRSAEKPPDQLSFF